MKKMIWIGAVMALALALNACSSDQTAAVQPSATSNVPAAPERTAEIYGKVTKLIGNEVTVALVEVSTPSAELTEAEKAAKQAAMQSLSTEERQKLKNEQLKLTGEKVTVILPVGTPIVAGGGGGSGSGSGSGGQTQESSVMTEVNLAELVEGTLLRIWLAEGGEGTEAVAEYTRVLQFLP